MLVSPSRKCPKCNGIIWDIKDDGRECMECGHFLKEHGLGFEIGKHEVNRKRVEEYEEYDGF